MSTIDDESIASPTPSTYVTSKEDRNRTITLRVSESEYDRIDALARINENPIATECRIAILERVEQSKNDDAVRARAGKVYAEIDAEAAKERAKIDAILGQIPGEAEPHLGDKEATTTDRRNLSKARP